MNRPESASRRSTMRRGLLGLTLVALFVPPTSATTQQLPRVLVIATGGTIAGSATSGQLSGEQLVEAVPELAEVAEIGVVEFSRVGSSAISPDHWVRLSALIDETFASDDGLAGIVVTHGTDTMEETGYFLHLTVQHRRPVVMVGSMRNSSAVSADGPANLLNGVRVAASEEAQGRGVLVVLNDLIHSARDVRKMDNNRLDTFRATEWGALGVVDADRIVYRRSITTRHTTTSDLTRPNDASELPSVPIVADYAGNDGSTLRALVDDGIDGVVVQAFGGGRGSPGMRQSVTYAAEHGVVVVLASRVPEGRVMPSFGNLSAGIAAAGDLPPHKARIVLMLALSRTDDASEIQRILDRH